MLYHFHIIGRELDSCSKGKEYQDSMMLYQLHILGRDLDSWLKGKEYQDSMVLYQLHILGRDLDSWLKEEGIPGLQGIDTRALTKVKTELYIEGSNRTIF